MWTDNETTIDFIGFRVQADLIRELVLRQDLLPTTVGIFGDWGSGKSSIMRMIERDLEPDNFPGEEHPELEGVAIVYFNGWQFEGYEDAKAAIMASIIRSLEKHRRFGPKVREKSKKILKAINWMRVLSFGMKNVVVPGVKSYLSSHTGLPPAPIPLTTADVSSFHVDVEQNNEASFIRETDEIDSSMSVSEFRAEFEKLLRDTDIRILVVLIDDLDRCTPERIIENLEAIKLFLTVKGTAFVIGADPRIVQHAVARRYSQGSVNSNAINGSEIERDYLEKVIQIPYSLPKLSPAEVEVYMSFLFCQISLNAEQEATILEAFKEHRTSKLHEKFEIADFVARHINPMPEGLHESLLLCRNASKLVTEVLNGNPRQVKRFLNVFMVRQKLAKVARMTSIRNDVMAKLMILEYANPTTFMELYRLQASQDGYPEELRALEDAMKTEKIVSKERLGSLAAMYSSPDLRKWTSLEPKLSDVDLRDYFWIARDKINASLQYSLVPQIVKDAVRNLQADNKAFRDLGTTSFASFVGPDRQAGLHLLRMELRAKADTVAPYKAFEEVASVIGHEAIDAMLLELERLPPSEIPTSAAIIIKTIVGRFGTHDALKDFIEKISPQNPAFSRVMKTSITKPKAV